MHRFFCPSLGISEDVVKIIDSEEIHHLRDVLRMQTGDKVELFNGRGEVAGGELIKVNARQVDVKISDIKKFPKQTPSITLACAIPKKSKFETIIEKATELGVDRVIPLITKRTEINIKGERADKKNKRYETVMLNASKQSKRVWLPTVDPMTDFVTAVEELAACSTMLIPSLTGNTIPLFQALSKIKDPAAISILIGPEGDFTPEEYAFAHEKAAPVSLGQTVLKVETAALCAVSCVTQYFNVNI
jgi:16S rRNA (uracil1498-N3)-methyltransferase